MAFAGKCAVVTGASSGIGWELAKQLAAAGARVGVLARRREPLEALAAEIRAKGGTVALRTADVAVRSETVDAVRGLCDELGGCDLMIANAGVGAPTTLSPFNYDDFEKMYRVNVFGVVHAVEAVTPLMIAKRSGHIAAISSMAGYKGLPGEWGYTSSKAAVNNLMDGLRVQMREYGVKVTNVCPGFIKTPMTAKNDFHMPFVMNADEAARRILRALARGAKVYNFPWRMNALMWLVARLPDWLVARVMSKYNENPPWPDKAL